MNETGPNEPSADNAGGFRRLAFTKPAKNGGKEKKQQVNPALRLPAGVRSNSKMTLALILN